MKGRGILKEATRVSIPSGREILSRRCSLLIDLGQYHLLPLRLPPLLALARVLPFVLLSPLDRRQFLSLDLAGLLDDLGKMTMSLDAPNLGHVAVPLDQRFVVFEGLTLLGGFDAASLGRIGSPETNVTVIGSAQEVFGIGGPGGSELVCCVSKIITEDGGAYHRVNGEDRLTTLCMRLV